MIAEVMLVSAMAIAPLNYEQCTVRDARGRIARDAGARRAFLRENPCPSTGAIAGRCPGYVVDHVIALKRCGADAPHNMQWQTIQDAREKDRWE